MADSPIAGVTAFFERQLESLSPRDRRLLMGLLSFGVIVGLGLLWWTLYGILDDKASRVRTARENLETARLYQAEYQTAAASLAAQESRLGQFANKRVSAHLEEIAGKRGVTDNLRKVNETGNEVVGNIKQTRYAVELKDLEHTDAIGFIYELETSGYPASINNADFKAKKKRDGASTLDLSLELVVFTLADG